MQAKLFIRVPISSCKGSLPYFKPSSEVFFSIACMWFAPIAARNEEGGGFRRVGLPTFCFGWREN